VLSHGIDLGEVLALATLLVWPAIPLFWIPVHCRPDAFRKIGFGTYIVPLVLWLPLAYAVYVHRVFLLGHKIDLPVALSAAGWMPMIAGAALQIWTGRLLSLKGLMGMPEIFEQMQGGLVTTGAFSVVRHPTYLSHSLMFAGIFLVTGVTAVGFMTLFDFALVNALIIPLEERELEGRFGDSYREYKSRVPRFFPLFSPRRGRG
jgi:protein-S-isoprenylcysteine O-methyltransferase Ste14